VVDPGPWSGVSEHSWVLYVTVAGCASTVYWLRAWLGEGDGDGDGDGDDVEYCEELNGQ